MMLSATGLSVLVWAAFAITALAPFIMIGLLLRDWRRGKLW